MVCAEIPSRNNQSQLATVLLSPCGIPEKKGCEMASESVNADLISRTFANDVDATTLLYVWTTHG